MAKPQSLAINARVTAFAMGGQQRVAAEIMKRLPKAEFLSPASPLGGMKGHAWEQFALPLKARGRLLWSPSATGPLLYPHQVVTVHDTAFFDVPEYFAPSFVRLYQSLVPRLARRVRQVVTVSEFSRRQMVKTMGIAAEKVEVIYNGVSSDFRPCHPATAAATRAALDLPKRYILMQATADRRKNLARMLDAWRLAASELPQDLHLVISGNLGRAHVFGDSSGINLEGPRIRAIGYVADEHMPPLMAEAEAFVFASLYEGFGLPVIEAMAAGTPVITGDNTALAEVAGDAALLVDSHSAQSIAQAMLEITGRPLLSQALRTKGVLRARRFTWDEAARRYGDIFDRLQTEDARMRHQSASLLGSSSR